MNSLTSMNSNTHLGRLLLWIAFSTAIISALSLFLFQRRRQISKQSKGRSMSSSPTEEPNSLGLKDELKEERSWRAEMFLALGFPLRTSTLMAKRRDISHHSAKRLLDNGASHEQAEKILL